MGLRLQANASLVEDEAQAEPQFALTGSNAASVARHIRGKSRRSLLADDILK